MRHVKLSLLAGIFCLTGPASAATVTDALELLPQSLTTLYTGQAPPDPAAHGGAPATP